MFEQILLPKTGNLGFQVFPIVKPICSQRHRKTGQVWKKMQNFPWSKESFYFTRLLLKIPHTGDTESPDQCG